MNIFDNFQIDSEIKRQLKQGVKILLKVEISQKDKISHTKRKAREMHQQVFELLKLQCYKVQFKTIFTHSCHTDFIHLFCTSNVQNILMDI